MVAVILVGAVVGIFLAALLWRALRARSLRGIQVLLRFDGVYQADADSDCRFYHRFYTGGTVISVTSNGTPADLRDWFTRDHEGISVGRIMLLGRRLFFGAKSSMGTVHYGGKIEGDSLRLRSFSQINGHFSTRVYVFKAWSDSYNSKHTPEQQRQRQRIQDRLRGV